MSAFDDRLTTDNIRERQNTESGVRAAAESLIANNYHFRGRSNCVRCRPQGRILYLDGMVPTHFLKDLACRIVKDLPGVERIVNRITVVNPRGTINRPAEPNIT